MISRICNQVFYSYERVDLPIKASIPTFILNLILCFSLYRSLGVYGLAIAGAISVWINVFIQIFYLKIYFSNFYKKIKFSKYFKNSKNTYLILNNDTCDFIFAKFFEFQ